MTRPDGPDTRVWDAVVIGAGMGGGAAAHALASRGFDVLLVEKGRSDFSPDLHDPAAVLRTDHEERLLVGRWPERTRMALNGRSSDVWPELGCGVGGSSLHYAATLGRFEPVDFQERELPDGRVARWPFSYDDLEPYYLQVEQLFGVTGTPDPRRRGDRYALGDPPAMTESDRQLFASFTACGLNPYRLHVGMNHHPDCRRTDVEFCWIHCRSDARTRFIEPLLKSGRLSLLDRSTAVGLEMQGSSAHSVEIERHGQRIDLRARAVVVAAGALFTPAVLLRSKGPSHPAGIGNHADLVGRHLMFHASDIILVWPRNKDGGIAPMRSFAFRDFYEHEDAKLGEVQTMGMSAGYGVILTRLHQQFDRSALRHLPMLKPFLRIPAFAAEKIFKQASVFSSIVEDYPYPENRVTMDDSSASGIRFDYTIAEELKVRVRKLRRLLGSTLAPHRLVTVNEECSMNLGHPCGTCRAGDDPATSVLDGNCRVHHTDNVYVADGSFMPTSGGTNPSLTIAANALRVADVIAERLQSHDL